MSGYRQNGLGDRDRADEIGGERTPLGFSLFGSRNVKVTGGDGPTIRLRGIVFLGSANVKPPKQT